MKISTWRVVHNYAAYLTAPLQDLPSAARRFVRLGYCDLATTNGQLIWRPTDNTSPQAAPLPRDPSALAADEIYGPILETDDILARNAAYASVTENARAHLLSANHDLAHRQLTCFLSPAEIVFGEQSILTLPILSLFDDGMAILSLPISGEGHELALQDVVDLCLLPFRRVTGVRASLRCARVLARALQQRKVGPFSRPRALIDRWLFDAYLYGTTRADLSNPTELATFYAEDHTGELAGVALEFLEAAAYCLGTAREGLAFALSGDRDTHSVRGYWFGRPHVHLVRFDNQATGATLNKERHGAAFMRILAKCEAGNPEPKTPLNQCTRSFDDYLYFVNEGVTLSVHPSDTGGASVESMTAEYDLRNLLLDYADIVHRSALESSHTEPVSWPTFFRLRSRLVSLDSELGFMFRFGELNTAMNEALVFAGVTTIRERIDAALSVSQIRASVAEGRRLARLGALVTLIVGALALPAFIDSWKMFDWFDWLGLALPPAWAVVTAGISLTAVAVLIARRVFFSDL